MSANYSADIFIPSVFVGEEAGWLIRDSYQFDSGYDFLFHCLSLQLEAFDDNFESIQRGHVCTCLCLNAHNCLTLINQRMF